MVLRRRVVRRRVEHRDLIRQVREHERASPAAREADEARYARLRERLHASRRRRAGVELRVRIAGHGLARGELDLKR